MYEFTVMHNNSILPYNTYITQHYSYNNYRNDIAYPTLPYNTVQYPTLPAYSNLEAYNIGMILDRILQILYKNSMLTYYTQCIMTLHFMNTFALQQYEHMLQSNQNDIWRLLTINTGE